MSKGRFGVHGGQYIPETLMNAMLELEEAYKNIRMIRSSTENSRRCSTSMREDLADFTMRRE